MLQVITGMNKVEEFERSGALCRESPLYNGHQRGILKQSRPVLDSIGRVWFLSTLFEYCSGVERGITPPKSADERRCETVTLK